MKKLTGDQDLIKKVLDQTSDQITNLGDQMWRESMENYQSKKQFSKE